MRRLAEGKGRVAADVDEGDRDQPLGWLTDAGRDKRLRSGHRGFLNLDAKRAQLLPGVASLEEMTPRGRLFQDRPELDLGLVAAAGPGEGPGVGATRRPDLI